MTAPGRQDPIEAVRAAEALEIAGSEPRRARAEGSFERTPAALDSAAGGDA